MHSSIADGAQGRPLRAIREPVHFRTGPRHVPAAWRDDSTSGSASTSCSQVIHGEWRPASPNRLTPPAISTSSGIQLPAAMSGSIHSMQATRGGSGAGSGGYRAHGLQACDQGLAASSDAQRARDTADVAPYVGERIGIERYDLRRERKAPASAASTSLRLTAQTSHCTCVMMWVGSSRSSTSGYTS